METASLPDVRDYLLSAFPPGSSNSDIADVLASSQALVTDKKFHTAESKMDILHGIKETLQKLSPTEEYGSLLPDLALNIRMFRSPWLWILKPLTPKTINRVFLIMVAFQGLHYGRTIKGVRYNLEVGMNEIGDVEKSPYLKKVDVLYRARFPHQDHMYLPLSGYCITWVIQCGNYAKCFPFERWIHPISICEQPLELNRQEPLTWKFETARQDNPNFTVQLSCATYTNISKIEYCDSKVYRAGGQDLEELGFFPIDHM
jgi:hypothetical protein